jgi:short-subunit dehydrogenase
VVNGLNTFVPGFQSRKTDAPSAIVITGSKQGITNPPGNAAYNASKSAVKTVAEHLSYDLRDTKISVHLVVPGWTFTGLVSSMISYLLGDIASSSSTQTWAPSHFHVRKNLCLPVSCGSDCVSNALRVVSEFRTSSFT